MAYNKAKEEYRWNQWKAEEETIQKLREYDWDDFKAEWRFREHQTSLLDCMKLLLEEKETKESQPESVEALLDTVENEELLQILLSTDKKTLQMDMHQKRSAITWNCRSRRFIQDCGGYGKKTENPCGVNKIPPFVRLMIRTNRQED